MSPVQFCSDLDSTRKILERSSLVRLRIGNHKLKIEQVDIEVWRTCSRDECHSYRAKPRPVEPKRRDISFACCAIKKFSIYQWTWDCKFGTQNEALQRKREIRSILEIIIHWGSFVAFRVIWGAVEYSWVTLKLHYFKICPQRCKNFLKHSII